MTNYQITIGYRAVITIDVKAENEAEAKDVALAEMKFVRDKMFKKKKIFLLDDRYAADGICNMDESWNSLY